MNEEQKVKLYQQPQSKNTIPSEEVKHSGLGIFAFVLSLLGVVGWFLLFFIAGYLQQTIPGGVESDQTIAGIIGIFTFGGFGLGFLTIILAIISLFQQNRKKLFGILAILISILFFLLVLGLVILGMSLK